MFAITVSPKMKNKKTLVIILAIFLVLVIFVAFMCVSSFVHTPPESVEIPEFGVCSTIVENDEQAQKFVEQFSYEIEEFYSLQQAYVPVEFDEVYTSYNNVQIKQGFDLQPYKGEKCELYIYKLKDYTIDNKPAYISVLVYSDRVIGGHVSTMVDGEKIYPFVGE